MSLKVWLPLNGNLNNQGCSPLKPVQSTAPTYVNGKIGQAMSTGAFYLPAAEVAKFYNNDEMSFCFWLYPIGTSGGDGIIGQQGMSIGDNRMFTIFQYPSPLDLHLSWQNNDSSTTFFAIIDSGFFTANTWNHCAIVYNGSIVKIYKNGSLYSTHNTPKSARSSFNYDVPIPSSTIRYLNDLRIYDHALSEKEVKEISKALVVHYPLDGNGKGNDNLVYGSNTASIDTNSFGYSEATGGSTREIEYDNNIPCVKITRNSTAHSGWDYFWYGRLNASALKTDTTYTISFDAIGSGNGTFGCSGFMNGNATNGLSNSTTAITNSFNSTGWSHIKFQTTTRPSFDDLSVGGQCVYMSCTFLRTTGTWIKLKNMKVEEGSVETPWCPAPSDDLYSKLGYNSTTEYDTSGFGNNGTKNGVLTTSSDTPRYSVATHFTNANSTYITIPAMTLDLTKVSISAWFRISSAQVWQRIFDLGEKIEGTGYSLLLALNNDGQTLTVAGRGANGAPLPDTTIQAISLNTWYHVVTTIDGTTCKTYVNGILVKTFTLNQAFSTATPMNLNYLGKSNWSVDQYLDGDLCDYRLYTTVLSADDIKELYQASASISDNGTMFGYDFNEE